MLPIYEIPSSIPEMFAPYRDCFESEAQYIHFLRYETGLLLPLPIPATIDGINKLFCGSLKRNQSSSNRFFTDSSWQTQRLEARRIEQLKQHPTLKPGKKGVIALDDVLLEKTGAHIEGVNRLFDPTQKKKIRCHCLVSCTYNKLGQSYPLALEPYFTAEVCHSEQGQTLHLTFRTKIEIAIDLVHQVLSWELPGLFAFDSWYLSKALVEEIEQADRLWISRAGKDTHVIWRGEDVELQQMTARLPKKAYHKVQIQDQVFWCALKVMPVSPLEEKKAVLVCWKDDLGQGEPFYLITNATWWNSTRMLQTYFQRWGIEELHREGKQHEGLADYQMRSLDGIRKHWCLVACAYAGLTLRRASHLRGIPYVLTLHSMAMEILLEVAVNYVRRVWEKAKQGGEAFLSIRRELEAFFQRFQITVQKPISAFRTG